MTRPRPPRHRQTGIALIALVVLLILAGSYAFYRTANLTPGRTQESNKQLARLALAKESLIAYAVTDAKRPGRLLCPDLTGTGVSPLLARDDCDAYAGLLPWKTLDLPEGSDDRGSPLRYVLSPLFGGDRLLPALNSDTPTSLRLDLPAGAASNDIAALIIASRGPVDAKNADGDDYYATGGSEAPEDNDLIVAITRQELMAAVEQRIANQLRSCLDQHASDPGNAQRTYPWPAPLSSTIFQGRTGSLFGMVPDTQPGNPEMLLKDAVANLNILKNSLNSASTVTEKLALANQLQAQVAYLRSLFDRIYLVAADLADKAGTANGRLNGLDEAIVAATTNKTTYLAQSGTLSAAIDTALPSLANFIAALGNSGFDLFLTELQLQNATLQAKIDAVVATRSAASLNALITPVNLFKNSLLENGWSPNADIEATIATAYDAAIGAASTVNSARKAPTDAALVDQAILSATTLYRANQGIEAVILASRFNLDPGEITYRANRLTATLNVLGTPSGLPSLILNLESTQALLTTLPSAAPPLATRRATTLSALAAALAAARAGNDMALIRSSTESAISQLTALAAALANAGDNVARETLTAVVTTLASARQAIPATVTAGRELRTPVKTAMYWSAIAVSQAEDIARLARKGITAKDDSDTSAYTAARKLLDSLDGEAGSLVLLDKASRNPNDAATAQAAQRALDKTLALLSSDLLATANKLDGALHTGLANAATPTVWYGSACEFLRPATGSSGTWWSNNGWKHLFFYQLSDRVRPVNGTLTVNGAGSYRAVAIASGRALPAQPNRTLRDVGQYLEKVNADPSRNGDAHAPSSRFVTEPVSTTFNDRLAY